MSADLADMSEFLIAGHRECIKDIGSASSSSSIELRVLLVEDDDFQQIAISGALEAAVALITEHDVKPLITITPTASGALAACKSRVPGVSDRDPFDLVLIDLFLPANFHGNELLPVLRASTGESTSVVMLSTQSSEPTLRSCLSAGADSYRIKPVAPTAITDLILCSISKQQFLREKRVRAATPQPRAGPHIPLIHGCSEEYTLAHGRRSPVYLSEREDTTVVIKKMDLPLRGSPPPEHPHLNKVSE